MLVLENYATLTATTPRLVLRNFTTLKQLQRQELALKKQIQAFFIFLFSIIEPEELFYFLIFQIHKQITGNHSLFQIKQHSVCKTKIGGIENVN